MRTNVSSIYNEMFLGRPYLMMPLYTTEPRQGGQWGQFKLNFSVNLVEACGSVVGGVVLGASLTTNASFTMPEM